MARRANPATPVGPKAEDTALDDGDKAEGEKDQEAEKRPKKRKAKRKPRKKTEIDKNVGQSTIELKVRTEQRNCNHCGLEMMCIGYVDHTRLEFYPVHFELVTRRCEKIA